MNKKILSIFVIALFFLTAFNVTGTESTSSEGECNICASSSDGTLSPSDIDELRQIGEQEGWTFTVGENSATTRSINQLCGLVPPDNLDESSGDIPLSTNLGVPDSFDWRSQGGVTPIRNQGSCGSCWAFATVGPLECAIKIVDGQSVDLSEQWLVSCTNAGSCSGGWFAHAYHKQYGGSNDYCGGRGAVLESDFPYVASNAPCNCPYDHHYFIDSYSSAGTTVESIKNAIYTHGPVSCAVYVNSAFQAYNGGIYDTSYTGTNNHAVVLVGWNDAQQYWILRNSWGTGWGEDGYMRIKYGCQGVGSNAQYIVYSGNGPSTEIEITNPDDESVVSGVVNIQGTVTAEDISTVSRVDVSIDGVSWHTANGKATWSYEWDSTESTNARHTILAKAILTHGYVSDMITVTVNNIGNRAPVADAGSEYSGYAREPIQFDGSASYDPDGVIELYEWDFGDGMSGTGVTPTHTYNEPGQYLVNLTVTDNNGTTDKDTAKITVLMPTNQAPEFSNPDPFNFETEVSLDIEAISIVINDVEGDNFDWSIETSPDIGSASGVNETNGTKVCPVSGLDYAIEYVWYVNATDKEGSERWTREFYTFYTIETPPPNRAPYKPVDPSPKDDATNVVLTPILQVKVTDPDLNLMNVSFYLNDVLIGKDLLVHSGDWASFSIDEDLEYDTTYNWYAIAEDGEFTNQSEIWTFKTIDDPTNLPKINLTKPLDKKLYRKNQEKFGFPFTFILGDIDVTAKVTDPSESAVKEIRFYIDDWEMDIVEYVPGVESYNWTWDYMAFFAHTIKVSAHDAAGKELAKDELNVIIFNI